MKVLTILLSVAVVVLLALLIWNPWCGAKRISEADRQQAMAFDEQFARAVLAKDAAAMTAMYTEDAMILSPGGDIVRGRAAIQSFNQAFTQIGITDFRLESVRIDGEGDHMYMVGRSTIRCSGAAAGNVNCRDGLYACTVNRQSDGTWKKSLAIWTPRS